MRTGAPKLTPCAERYCTHSRLPPLSLSRARAHAHTQSNTHAHPRSYSRLGGNASKATNGQLLKLVRYSAPLSPLGGLAVAELQLAKAEAFVALSVGEALPRRARAAQEVALAAEAARARQQAASEAQLRLQ